ncbi:MAG: sodium:proton antiporter, partial [Isosphaeraceae bacterium]
MTLERGPLTRFLHPARQQGVLLTGFVLAWHGLATVQAAPKAVLAEVAHAAHPVPSIGWTIPFVLLLLAIAVFPLVPRARHRWERNEYKLLVGLTLSAVVLGYYSFRGFGFHTETPGTLTTPGLPTTLEVVRHAVLADYVPFIVLLFTLYVVAGGLQIKGDLRAWPVVNTGILALGAVMASLIGTTGASMVLIRPLLQTNSQRTHVRHTVVFFIFLVSNIGGSLLPIGDPPLFLGYLKGVPFLWTLNLIAPWMVCVSLLLAIYYIWDRIAYHREPAKALAEDVQHHERLRLRGAVNLIWLLGIVLSVALIVPGKPFPGTDWIVRDYVREAVMLALAGLSLATTPRGLRRETEFTYQAILEVGALFLGIFLTMQVPIEILQARGAELGLTTPLHFFWATGSLSSFLDNAPTYLVFLETAKVLPRPEGVPLIALIDGSVREDLLLAISMGAVFMGANTYIGNGPNFMVKSIAEERGVRMPSFFGYMLYSVTVLVPLFLFVSWLFF